MGEGVQAAPRSRRRALRWVGYGAVVVVLAGAGITAIGLRRPLVEVRWREVLAAARQRGTVHGRGLVYGADGAAWEYAVWGRFGKQFESRAMLSPRGEVGDPGASVLARCRVLECYGEDGAVSRLAERAGPSPAEDAEWGGRPALITRLKGSEVGMAPVEGIEGFCRVILDPESQLVRAVELFGGTDGRDELLGRCEYEYDLGLPPGFEELIGDPPGK